ncbi:MAG: hypothetical protein ACTSYA_09420 [Candidatus Kariarchaeaceae archaeon]
MSILQRPFYDPRNFSGQLIGLITFLLLTIASVDYDDVIFAMMILFSVVFFFWLIKAIWSEYVATRPSY